MTLAAELAANYANMAAQGLGTVAASYDDKSGAAARPVTVAPHELPAEYAAQITGQTDVRVVDLLVLPAEVPAPARDQTFTISAAPHAGTWTVLSIERRDAAAFLLRARWADRKRAQIPGVQELAK